MTQPSRWYIKLAEETIGPITDAELNELVCNGNISPETPVSSDRNAWFAARAVPGVATRAARPRTPNPPKRPPIGAARVVISVVLVAVIACAAAYMYSEFEPPTVFNGNSAQASANGLGQTTSTRESQAATRTYEYWAGVGGILRRTPPTTDVAASISAFRSLAGSIEALPTAGHRSGRGLVCTGACLGNPRMRRHS